MEYLHIKNIEKYHPGYKDRDLQWCKTYFKMINADPDFEMLDEIDKWRFVAFVMLELQIKKPIPLDGQYLIKKGFNLKKYPIYKSLQMLHNFVEVVTEDKKLCVLEKEGEKEKEEEGDCVTGRKRFVPPTLEQVKDYIKQNNYNLNAEKFFKYFTEAEPPWTDSKGNKVRNWKQKIITWSENRGSNSNSKNAECNENRGRDFSKQESSIGETV